MLVCELWVKIQANANLQTNGNHRTVPCIAIGHGDQFQLAICPAQHVWGSCVVLHMLSIVRLLPACLRHSPRVMEVMLLKHYISLNQLRCVTLLKHQLIGKMDSRRVTHWLISQPLATDHHQLACIDIEVRNCHQYCMRRTSSWCKRRVAFC